jgi:hypothetical protein
MDLMGDLMGDNNRDRARARRLTIAAGVVAFAALASSCAVSERAPAAQDEAIAPPVGRSDDDAGAPDGGTRDVPLEMELRDGDVSRLYAHVAYRGAPALLLVDTASQVTFLSAPELPDGALDVGVVVIGGASRSLRGRPIVVPEAERTVRGVPVVGFLGADWFLEAETREIDLGDAVIRAVTGAPPPGSASIPFTVRHGYIFADVTLDDEPVVLAFDTGAPHTLRLGADGRPGDVEVPSVDANGTPVRLFLGHGMLAAPAFAQRVVPVLRTTSFPSMEASNRQLGGGIHGLLGLSAFGRGRIRVDSSRRSITFARGE